MKYLFRNTLTSWLIYMLVCISPLSFLYLIILGQKSPSFFSVSVFVFVGGVVIFSRDKIGCKLGKG